MTQSTGAGEKPQAEEPKLSPDQFDLPFPYVFGCPTKYRREFIPYILEWSRQGKTVAYMASQLSVGRRTFFDWVHEFPEFAQAYEVCRINAQNYWEDVAHRHMVETKDGEKLNTNLYKFMMSSHFKEVYTPQQEITVAAKDGPESVPGSLRETISALEDRIRGGTPIEEIKEVKVEAKKTKA